MTKAYYLGVGLGLLVGFVLVFVLLKVTRTDHNINTKYDERQERARGKGFKYAFFALLICNAIVVFVGEDASKYVDYSILIILGIVISLIIYAGYCIFNGAYIALNETPKRTIIAFLVIGILNLGLFFSNHAIVSRFGRVDSSYINLICGFAMFVIAGLIGIKQLIDKREEA